MKTEERSWNKNWKVKNESKENTILKTEPMTENINVAFEEMEARISIKTNRMIIWKTKFRVTLKWFKMSSMMKNKPKTYKIKFATFLGEKICTMLVFIFFGSR